MHTRVSPFDRRPPLAADELLAVERVQRLLDRTHAPSRSRPGLPARRPCRGRPRPGGAPSPPAGEQVEPGGDQALNGLGQRQILRSSRAPSSIARVSARRRAGCRPRARGVPAWVSAGSTACSSQLADETRRVVRPTVARSRTVAALTLPPPQPGLRSSSSGRAVHDHEQRHVARPFDQVVHEVEQALVRPLEVLEDEDQRAPLRKRLEEAPPGGERLARADPRSAPGPSRARRAAAAAGPPSPRPRRRPRAVRTLRSSLSAATFAESVSRMPACALTISLSAQYVTPSP